jgi:hypothetical protein
VFSRTAAHTSVHTHTPHPPLQTLLERMSTFDVVVPPGVRAGDAVAFQDAGGATLEAIVPDGLGEGDVFQVQVSDDGQVHPLAKLNEYVAARRTTPQHERTTPFTWRCAIPCAGHNEERLGSRAGVAYSEWRRWARVGAVYMDITSVPPFPSAVPLSA